LRQHRLLAEVENTTPAHYEHIMRSGFTMNDIKGLRYNEDAGESDEVLRPSRPARKGSLIRPSNGFDAPTLEVNGRIQRSTSDLDVGQYSEGEERPDDKNKKRGRSPFRLFGKKRDQSKDKLKGKGEAEGDKRQGRNVIQSSIMTRSPTVKVSNADLRIQAPSVPERQKNLKLGSQHIESIGNEVYDSECLKLINEYFYGVRIYPGQDPTHVYIGWVTTQYHLHSHDFKQDNVRRASVFVENEYEEPIGQ
jgi:ryanodine receptor 2